MLIARTFAEYLTLTKAHPDEHVVVRPAAHVPLRQRAPIAGVAGGSRRSAPSPRPRMSREDFEIEDLRYRLRMQDNWIAIRRMQPPPGWREVLSGRIHPEA